MYTSIQNVAFIVSFGASLILLSMLPVDWLKSMESRHRGLVTTLRLLVVVLCVCIFAVLLFPGQFRNFIYYLNVDLSFIVIVCFGILSALAADTFYRSVKQNADRMYAALLFIIFVSVGVLGLFWPQLPTLFSSLQSARIQTSGIEIVLKSERQVYDVALKLNYANDQSSVSKFDQKTNYQLGVGGVRATVQYAMSDHRRIQQFCTDGVPDSICKTGSIENLLESLSAAEDYFQLIAPLSHCLSSYSDRFPNGLPIQEELSEIAIYYVNRKWKAIGGSPSQTEAPTLPRQEFNNILAKLKGLTATAFDGTQFGCDGLDPGAIDAADRIVQRWTSQGTKTPHRTLLEAYTIVAAGYPYDAAQHLDRDFRQQEVGTYGLMPATIFSVRVYSALEQIYAHVAEIKRQIESLDNLSGSYQAMFAGLLGNTSGRYDSLLDICSRGSIEGTAFAQILSGKTPAEQLALRLYIVQSIYVALASEVRRWQVRTTNGLTGDEPAKIVEMAAILKSIFNDESRYNGCFAYWIESAGDQDSRNAVLHELNLTLAEIGITSGMLNIAALDVLGRRRSQVNLSLEDEERRQYICNAKDIFRSVNDWIPVAENTADGGQTNSGYSEIQVRLSRYLQQIKNSNVDCAFLG